ncbi:CCA tRNA nucleotidyltransferase [Weissella diestrammenae]|uniref:CCA-adding enzyme n=1 Tax=Weissella diestrammenae TaxID=1162633 RepID=A0A7G9T5R7_9LACO|nr:CCA tRNA nucleotidyltransferase [Weissella diestrammenae]MCM0582270.1 CCA tRNA nucleotidyltransferase [Weissella diestrammenae]QNN75442.1 CCA tRNA nucleotidyltransferase [Weissella diestrammenae]
MQIKHLPEEFKSALPIIHTLEAAGYEAYFVGGAVRDTLLNKPIHDVDIATSAYPEEVKQLFDRTVDTGIEHGTVMILDHGQGYETTTFRTESTYTDFRRPDQVTFVRSLSDDLKRRDFTINALALRGDGLVVDLFNGVSDLEHQTLRAVGHASDRFQEDALRMMRAVRFAAQLDFTIEPDTKQAIVDHAPLLEKIAIERVNVELTKMLQGRNAQYGLLELLATRLNAYMPGLKNVEIDLWGYAELLAKDQPDTPTVAWTLLAFELGLTPKDTETFLRLWKHGNELIQQAQKAITLLNVLRQSEATNWQLYMTGDAFPNAMRVLQLSQLPNDVLELKNRYMQLAIHHRDELQISGKILQSAINLQPGPMFGKILGELEKLVVAGQVANNQSDLIARAKAIAEKEK